MKIYGDSNSGNCYKVKLLCALLDISYEWQEMNILQGDTQTAEFLSINPNGKIPAIVLDNGFRLSESNAILGYLAEGSCLIPQDRYWKAKMYEWLFFEQYSHEPTIAVARFIRKYLDLPEERLDEYEALLVKGRKALDIMEKQLSTTPYLVGQDLSLADIALYAYTHVAHEGGFDLCSDTAIRGWCQRIEQQANYTPIGD